MSKRMGIDWLKANDPTYVSPAMKAAETKRTAWSVESALAYIGGDGCSKAGKNGKRISLANPVAFNGSEEGGWSVEPAIDAQQENVIDLARYQANATHKKGGNKTAQNKAARDRKRQAKRLRLLGK